jgi:hypothetical protein
MSLLEEFLEKGDFGFGGFQGGFPAVALDIFVTGRPDTITLAGLFINRTAVTSIRRVRQTVFVTEGTGLGGSVVDPSFVFFDGRDDQFPFGNGPFKGLLLARPFGKVRGDDFIKSFVVSKLDGHDAPF